MYLSEVSPFLLPIAVRLGACYGHEVGCEIEFLDKYSRVLRGISRAIVREMLGGLPGSSCAEAIFDCLQHHVAHVRAGDACIGDCRPSDDLVVEDVDDEGETNDLFIPAGC